MIRLAFVLCLLATAAIAAGWQVTDGDGIHRDGQRVRLFGIDAPEAEQQCRQGGACYRCGRAAADALQRLLGGSTVTVLPTGDRSYDRIVARVFVGQVDVAEAMLRQGHAVTYRRFLKPGPVRDAYLAAEAAARAAGRGLWAGDFDQPGDWRRHRGTVCGGDR